MKKTLLCLLLIVMTAAAEAQPESGKLSIIPRLGVSLANMQGDKLSLSNGQSIKPGYKSGMMAGVDVEYQLTDQLALSIGGYYSQQGAQYKDFRQYTNEEMKEWDETKKMRYNIDYVNVPIMIMAYPVKNFSLKVGVQLGIKLDGKYEYTVGSFAKDKDNKIHMTHEFKTIESNLEMRNLDVSIPFGAAYEYKNVIVDARYNLGLTKVYNNRLDGKNSFFTFNVGYRFQL